MVCVSMCYSLVNTRRYYGALLKKSVSMLFFKVCPRPFEFFLIKILKKKNVETLSTILANFSLLKISLES